MSLEATYIESDWTSPAMTVLTSTHMVSPQCTQEVEEVNLAVHGIYLIVVMYACVHNIQISHTLNEGWGAQLHE